MSTPKLAKPQLAADSDPSAPDAPAPSTAPVQRSEAKLAPLNHPAWSQRKASLIGGIALFLLAVLAGLANFGVVEVLVTPGDAARTAQDLINSEGLVSIGHRRPDRRRHSRYRRGLCTDGCFRARESKRGDHGRRVQGRLCDGLHGGDQPAGQRIGASR